MAEPTTSTHRPSPRSFLRSSLQTILRCASKLVDQTCVHESLLKLAIELNGHQYPLGLYWPRVIPQRLPEEASAFSGLKIQDTVYPAFVLDKSQLDRYEAAFRQRRTVLQAHMLLKKQLNESARRERYALRTAQELKPKIAAIEKELDDRSEAGDDWTSQDVAREEELKHMKGHFYRNERFREILAMKRAAVMSNLLDRHLEATLSQDMADRQLRSHMINAGLLRQDSGDFFETWKLLPIDHQKSRNLHGDLLEIKCKKFSQTTPGSEEVWNALAHDQASLMSARVGYESAQADLKLAKSFYGMWTDRVAYGERNYGKLRTAGRDLPTLSEYNEEALRGKRVYLDEYVKAEQNLQLAARRVMVWNDFCGELKNQPDVFVPDPGSDDGSQIDDLEMPARHYMRESAAARVEVWQEQIDPIDSEYQPAETMESRSTIDLPTESVQLDDSWSMCELRPYELVRAHQWSNMKEDEHGHFAASKARQPALIRPLVGAKRDWLEDKLWSPSKRAKSHEVDAPAVETATPDAL